MQDAADTQRHIIQLQVWFLFTKFSVIADSEFKRELFRDPAWRKRDSHSLENWSGTSGLRKGNKPQTSSIQATWKTEWGRNTSMQYEILLHRGISDALRPAEPSSSCEFKPHQERFSLLKPRSCYYALKGRRQRVTGSTCEQSVASSWKYPCIKSQYSLEVISHLQNKIHALVYSCHQTGQINPHYFQNPEPGNVSSTQEKNWHSVFCSHWKRDVSALARSILTVL